jgi:hypothetical protein
MKRIVTLVCLTLTGCSSSVPTTTVARPPTKIEKRCNCWLHRSVTDTVGCPCKEDCDCQPKSKCACDCHCGEPKR